MGTAVGDGVEVGVGEGFSSNTLFFGEGRFVDSSGTQPVKAPCSIRMPPFASVPFSITDPLGISMWASPMGVCIVSTVGERRVIRAGVDWA